MPRHLAANLTTSCRRGADTPNRSSKLLPAVVKPGAVLAAIALVLASCGSGDGGDSATEPTAQSPSSTTAAEVEIPTVSSTGVVSNLEASATTEPVAASLGLFPLTGVPVGDSDIVSRPVIAAKIDNVEAARPQAGLVQADVVYEEIVEGGLTRLLALFHSQDADLVGPIRSARSTDVPLLTPLREPIFAWSGANSAFAALIRSVAIRDIGFEAQPSAYVRAADRSAPSNLMTSTADLYDLVESEGDLGPNSILTHVVPGSSFGGGTAARGVEVDYGATTVVHEWDAAVGGWVRTQNGSPHVDTDGEAIAPENVIVQFVSYRDTGLVDASGAIVPEAVLEGSGEAWFFSAGNRVVGTWSKANVTAAAQYLDGEGEVVRLSAGRTWILLVREGTATLL